MIASMYCMGNKQLLPSEQTGAKAAGKNAIMGVGLYALGKWIAPKISKTLTSLFTGVNRDLKYTKRNI